jgi:hypothetical protein
MLEARAAREVRLFSDGARQAAERKARGEEELAAIPFKPTINPVSRARAFVFSLC